MESNRRVAILLLIAFAAAVLTLPGFAEGNGPARDYWPTLEWKTSTPDAQGMDPVVLDKMMQKLEKRRIDGALVIRHGYIVAEHYWNQYDTEMLHPVFSCTKSVSSILIGMLMDKGLIKSLDQPMTDFFPEWLAPGVDPRKQTITLRHVMTMTSGLDWPESANYNSPKHVVNQWLRSADWVKFVLDRPVSRTPGTRFNYSTGSSHLLTSIVRRTSGKTPLEFGQENLFGPLGITNFTWTADPAGTQCGGFGLAMTPRDMAKVGFLYLNRGSWDGRQLVSAAWVDESISEHLKVGPLGYGLQWWIWHVSGMRKPAFAAMGLGNQLIFVIPALDIVAVFTDGNPKDLLLPKDCLDYVVNAVNE